MTRIRIVLFYSIIAILLICPCVTAAPTGILAGTITDLDGNGIAGASVSLYRGQNLLFIPKNPQTTIGDPSIGSVGHYGFKDIPTGRYRIVVEKSSGSGKKYTAEQQVSVTAGTVIQDIVLDMPEPTIQPVQVYQPVNSAATDGFGAILAVIALTGAVLILRPPR